MAYRNGGLDSWDMPGDSRPGMDSLTFIIITLLLLAVIGLFAIGVRLSM